MLKARDGFDKFLLLLLDEGAPLLAAGRPALAAGLVACARRPWPTPTAQT